MQITPTLPSPAPVPQAGGPARSADGGFAELLSQRQAEPPAAERANPDAEAPDNTDSDAAAAPNPRADESRSARARTADRGRTARAAAPAAAPARSTPENAADAERAADPADPAQADAAPLDPALAHWLAGLHLPAGSPATPAIGGGGREAVADQTAPAVAAAGAEPASTDSAPGQHDSRALAARAGGRDDNPLAAERADGTRRSLDSLASAERAEMAEAEAESTQLPAAASTPLASNPRSGPEAGVAALAAAPTRPAAANGSVSAPVGVAFTTPVDAPEFARAFGVQVSVLARDGVQHAELHLNPVETGPVSVQLALEGTQARIDFGADAAATREAIEQSLPELAAALREAGFTLSGGGVSPHAGGRDGRRDAPGDGAARPGGARGEAETVAASARPWRGTLSASGVDLYA